MQQADATGRDVSGEARELSLPRKSNRDRREERLPAFGPAFTSGVFHLVE
jgi:hypothetical protein